MYSQKKSLKCNADESWAKYDNVEQSYKGSSDWIPNLFCFVNIYFSISNYVRSQSVMLRQTILSTQGKKSSFLSTKIFSYQEIVSSVNQTLYL